MKNVKPFLTLVCLTLSLSALSKNLPVELNAKEIFVKASKAVVARTNKTPKKVTLTLQVPLKKAFCVKEDVRHVRRTSAFECGEDFYTRNVTVDVCVRESSYGNCQEWRTERRRETYSEPRTCLVPEYYCAKYGTKTVMKNDEVTIAFKKLPALGDSESDTFEITGQQKAYDRNDVVYSIKQLDTVDEYKTSQKKFLGMIKMDGFIIERK